MSSAPRLADLPMAGRRIVLALLAAEAATRTKADAVVDGAGPMSAAARPDASDATPSPSGRRRPGAAA